MLTMIAYTVSLCAGLGIVGLSLAALPRADCETEPKRQQGDRQGAANQRPNGREQRQPNAAFLAGTSRHLDY